MLACSMWSVLVQPDIYIKNLYAMQSQPKKLQRSKELRGHYLSAWKELYIHHTVIEDNLDVPELKNAFRKWGTLTH